MIPGRQLSWRPWFPWGFSLAPSRKRAAVIRSAGEPNSEIGPNDREGPLFRPMTPDRTKLERRHLDRKTPWRLV